MKTGVPLEFDSFDEGKLIEIDAPATIEGTMDMSTTITVPEIAPDFMDLDFSVNYKAIGIRRLLVVGDGVPASEQVQKLD